MAKKPKPPAIAKKIDPAPVTEVVARPGPHPGNADAVEFTMVRMGPMPDALELARYHAIDPAISGAIVSSFKEEGAHRREMERTRLDAAIGANQSRSQYGLFLAIAILGVALVLGMFDHDWLAGTIITSELVTLGTAYVTGRIATHKKKPSKPESEQDG